VRDGNEDRFVIREDGGLVLLAVADGVGGGPGGEIAAEAAVNELAGRFFAAPRTQPIAERLGDAMREANTAVLKAAEASSKPSAATTLVAGVVDGRSLVIANLGDSRAYLVRDGASRQITEDHAGTVEHGITRFVGDSRGVQADVFMEELQAGDRLVLCSDGLTRHVPDGDIASTVRGADLDQAATALVDLAKSRGGEDNITVVLYATRRTFGLADLRHNIVNLVLALLVAGVVVGAIAALVFASGAYPTAR